MTFAHLLRVARQRWRSVAEKDSMDRELGRELAFHLDQLAQENVDAGMSQREAREAARRAIGNAGLVEEECRDHRRTSWLHDLKQDTIYGWRMLRQSPGFTFVAAASLALGIGAHTAIVGVANTLLFRELAVPEAERVFILRTYPLENPKVRNNAPLGDYFAWKRENQAFASMGASLSDQRDFGAEENGVPAERIQGIGVSHGLFETLRVKPFLGRLFSDEELQPEMSSRIVVISHRLWTRRFNSDPEILNHAIRLNGETTAVIGVMREDFHYLDERIDYWVPLRARNPVTGATINSPRYWVVAARLKDGITMEAAQSDMDRIAEQRARDFPDQNKGWGVRVQPLREAMFGWTATPLLTLEAAVALVLLIACANVAGLLIARTSKRRPELAMRIALGASRGRILRQILTESVLLSLIAGALGIGVAWAGLQVVGSLTPPPGATRIFDVGLNVRTVVAAFLTSILVGLLFSVAPALAAASRSSLRESSGVAEKQHRLRDALVASQIALAMVLLIGSGLLTASFMREIQREFNFDPSGMLSFDYRLPSGSYNKVIGADAGFPYYETTTAPAQIMERMFERLKAIPGGESVAGISHPHVNSLVVPFANAVAEGGTRQERVSYFLITPGFFATMRGHLKQGREFQDRDTAQAPWGVVINEAFARRMWPGENPLGKQLRLDLGPEERLREVIGVIRDIPTRSAVPATPPVAYVSYLQQPSRLRGPFQNAIAQMTFLIRTSGDPLSLAPAAREAAAEVDPDHPLSAITTAGAFVAGRMREQGFYALSFGLFAVTATLLAAIGVYAVMAYSVARRTREIGIRIAMGASAAAILRTTGGRALALIAAGIGAGVVISLALTRLIESQLWQVASTDPLVYMSVSVLLAGTALLACLVPARRAIRVNPTSALRSE